MTTKPSVLSLGTVVVVFLLVRPSCGGERSFIFLPVGNTGPVSIKIPDDGHTEVQIRTDFNSPNYAVSLPPAGFPGNSGFSPWRQGNTRISPGFGTGWNYESSGPVTWPGHFPQCNGKRQSPINLVTSKCRYRNMPLTFSVNFSQYVSKFRVKYDGAAIRLVPVNRILLNGIGMTGQSYVLCEIHFHWSSVGNRGSEHAVNGVKYPLELHLLSYNSKYRSQEDAMRKPDGLAAMATFFNIGTPNAGIQQILQGENALQRYGERFKVLVRDLDIRALFPSHTERFFRYHGSITTPPCSENVIWTVFEEPQTMSEEQFRQFQGIRLERTRKTRYATYIIAPNNVRPLQPENGRPLFSSNPAFR